MVGCSGRQELETKSLSPSDDSDDRVRIVGRFFSSTATRSKWSPASTPTDGFYLCAQVVRRATAQASMRPLTHALATHRIPDQILTDIGKDGTLSDIHLAGGPASSLRSLLAWMPPIPGVQPQGGMFRTTGASS